MTRTQFWILTCTVIFIAPLFGLEIFLSRIVHNDERKVMILERVAEEGNTYTSRFQQLAVRTYQLTQQDPGLKDVLARNHIDVKAQSPVASPGLGAPIAPPPPNPTAP